jgi:hypothetical protein
VLPVHVVRKHEWVFIRGSFYMDCEMCNSIKADLAQAIKNQVSANHEFDLAVIRGDGSSADKKRRLDQAVLHSATVSHELTEHHRQH